MMFAGSGDHARYQPLLIHRQVCEMHPGRLEQRQRMHIGRTFDKNGGAALQQPDRDELHGLKGAGDNEDR
ncbi:hypothetical protein D3C84_1231140 [compost metagenome]